MPQAIPASLSKSAALQYIVSKGWEWTGGDGGQVQVQICPFCKKDNSKFYVCVSDPAESSRDGLYFCHNGSCQVTGNLRKLQEHLGDRIAGVDSRKEWAGKGDSKPDALPDVDACHAALLGDAETLDYLINVRGFTEAIINQQKLGIKEKVWFRAAGETKGLVIPYLVNGNCVFAKYRTLPPSPKDFSCPSGWEAPLYNADVLVEGCQEIILVEGEADAISLLSQGITSVVGVPGAGVKKATWIEALDKISPPSIYILYDNDKAGTKGAQELASRIGIEKCRKIVLPKFEITEDDVTRPGKDINEWFTKGGGTVEAFEELKRTADLFDVTGVTGSKDALEELEDELNGKEDLAPTYISQWPEFNKLVGFENGDVIDIVAPEKVGKSTLALNLLDHMVSTYDEPGLFVCLEMSQARLARKWVALLTGFEDVLTAPGTPESKAKLEELKGCIVTAREIQSNRGADLYFAYPMLVKEPEDVMKLIRDCVRRYGVKWVVFDNLQRLCDDTLKNAAHRTVWLSQISKQFAKLTKDYNIKLIRILQPKRIEKGHTLSTNDVDGSSQVAKDCDCMITMWRSPSGGTKLSEYDTENLSDADVSFDAKTIMNVGLSRYSAGGKCFLYFDGARSQVKNWDDRPQQGTKVEYNSIVQTETSVGPALIPTEGEITI